MTVKAQPDIQYTDELQAECDARLETCASHIKLSLERLHLIRVERCLGGQGEFGQAGILQHEGVSLFLILTLRRMLFRHWRKVDHCRSSRFRPHNGRDVTSSSIGE